MKSILSEVAIAWRPPPEIDLRTWVPQNIRIPDVTETEGEFDLVKFPHVPEVLEQASSSGTRVIILSWATRNAKTYTVMSIMAALVALTGRPAVLAGPDRDRTTDTLEEEFLPLLEQSPGTRNLLLPRHLRNNDKGVRLGKTLVRKAYGGSKGRLAGYPACVGVINEAGLWSSNSISRLLQRGRLFPFDSLFLIEGKPEEKGSCALTEMANADTVQRRYRYVQCPLCNCYQRLQWGSKSPDDAGIKWQRPTGRRSDPILARDTAYYQCLRGCRLQDEHRKPMMGRGLWVPEGCKVSKRGRVSGKPLVNDETRVAFVELSTLYSLAISGWGQIVSEFMDLKDSPGGRREFFTGTLAREFDPRPQSVMPDELAKRLASDVPLYVCPEWARFVTVGVDVGRLGEELVFYWLVSCWGVHARGQLLDYGLDWGAESFLERIRGWQTDGFQHDDGGPPLRPVRIGIDSGSFTNEVYKFCEPAPNFWPMKGSSIDRERPFVSVSFPEMYQPGFQRVDVPAKLLQARRKQGLYDLLIPNTNRSQDWIEARINGLIKRDAEDWYSIPLEVFHGETVTGIDLTGQLLNDYRDERGHWKKRGDNEYRDALRYSMVLAWHFKRNGQDWKKDMPRQAEDNKLGKSRNSLLKRGPAFLVTDR